MNDGDHGKRSESVTAPLTVVVVLFRPDEDECAYIEQLQRGTRPTLVIDNSPGATPTLDVNLLVPTTNLGTAGAVAVAARCVKTEWMLVLDQDTRAPAGFLDGAQARLAQAKSNVGQIAPARLSPMRQAYSASRIARAPRTPVLSGSLLRLAAIRDLPDMRADVPLDGFDFALSLWLQSRGWDVQIDASWILDHRVGDERTESRGFGGRVSDHSHGPERFYLMGRATRYLATSYTAIFPGWVARHLAARALQLVVVARADRSLKRLAAFARGISSRGDIEIAPMEGSG